MLTHMLRAAAGNSTPAPTGPAVWSLTGNFINANVYGYSVGTGAAAWSGGGSATSGAAGY